MNLLTSVAATEGEFLLISGRSYCLYSSANSSARRDEMMSVERGRKRERESAKKRGGTKEYHEEKKCCRASMRESVNDCL